MSAIMLADAARLFEDALEAIEAFAVESRKQIGLTASACDVIQHDIDMQELRDTIDEQSQDLAVAAAFLEGLEEKCSELQILYADVSAQLDRCIDRSLDVDEDRDDFSPSSISPLA